MTILSQSSSVRFVRLVLLIGGIGIADAVLTAQQPASSPQPVSVRAHPPSPELQTRPRYHIEPGDMIQLDFPLETDFNQAITVAPDGYVSLKGIGDFYAAGKSLPELYQALLTAYSGILHNPIINVELKDFQKPFFLVSGQVAHPGKFDLREDLTVTEALALAGGVTESAKSSQVLLFRRVQGGSMVEARKLDMRKMYKKGDLTEDILLQPGDLIFVPQTAISKIQKFLPTSAMELYAPGIP
jgi:polysaccharide biosynthesis/export protein